MVLQIARKTLALGFMSIVFFYSVFFCDIRGCVAPMIFISGFMDATNVVSLLATFSRSNALTYLDANENSFLATACFCFIVLEELYHVGLSFGFGFVLR